MFWIPHQYSRSVSCTVALEMDHLFDTCVRQIAWTEQAWRVAYCVPPVMVSCMPFTNSSALWVCYALSLLQLFFLVSEDLFLLLVNKFYQLCSIILASLMRGGFPCCCQQDRLLLSAIRSVVKYQSSLATAATFRRNMVRTCVMWLAVVPAKFADCAHTAPPRASVQWCSRKAANFYLVGVTVECQPDWRA